MKFSTTLVPEPEQQVVPQYLQFANGIVGFPYFTRGEIVYQPDQQPFMWLRSVEGDPISFLVVEPAGLVPNYEIEITDPDMEALDIRTAEDALILNVASVHKTDRSQKITLNLLGPIVVNRRTLQARQIIIGNCQKYSARYVLFESSAS